MSRRSVVVTVALLGAGRLLEAQSVECLRPVGCVSGVPSKQEVIILKVTGTPDQPAGKTVFFAASSGKMADSVSVDSDGIAKALWTADRPASHVQISVTVAGKNPQSQIIRFGQPVKLAEPILPRPRWYHDAGLWSRDPQWYEKRQLKRPMSVAITDMRDSAITDRAQCEGAAVIYSSHGKSSEVKPDTAYGHLYYRGNARTCEANGNWLMGEGAGRHLLRATLVSDASERVEYTASSRALPWLGLGLAASYDSRFVESATKEQAIKVTRRSQVTAGGDSLEVTYDSTAKVTRPDSVDTGARLSPVIGINFPIVLRAQWLRAYLGADLKNPRSDWYAGLSLMQLTAGWQHESVGYDLSLVMHISRRSIVTNPDCAPTPAACEVETRTRPVGGALVFSINAESVLDKLFTALGVK